MLSNYLVEYLDFKTCLIGFLLVLLLLDIYSNKSPSNFPPGPWPLPFVGNIFTGVDFKTIDKLAEKYGDVFSLRWGNQKTVVISGHKMVKEALITQPDSFADRPVLPLFHKVYKGLGNNGYLWKNQRKFVIISLRHFGEGKVLELSIQQESIFLCDVFKAEQGPFDPQFFLNAVSNIISALVFGHRFEYHDENFLNILRLDAEAVVLAGFARSQLYNVFPRLFEYLPGPHKTIFDNYAKIIEFMKGEVRKHKEDWDPSNPRDYVDNFLLEMEKKKSDPEAGFNVDTLLIAMLDLFEAGTESAATTMRWGLFFMMKYPEIQKKVQDEIDKVIGQSRQARIADKANMPYTEAVIHEIQRMGNIVPLGFPKMATKDTELGGFFIPKGTAVTTNLSSVLNDKSQWETPDTFNPGHFLDEQGRFLKKEAFLPFSAGRRACVGEQLARMELFLFFTSLLQSFSFSPCPGDELSLEGQMGFTYAPKPFCICVNPR
ncbi:cytochrome P450, family 2, subfamily AD, polypeptide 2 [Silurus asotus]|uniref:Cytochrome P450, family 2, subfamily AD, polypeptide 2 n=1 Tax=Silurus asotus TaxID=30991 RepID=A0AAD5AVR1_SILAS|nr:cytochrome P450, family 2, subfamily AD, polypeptide 2 [Silurus asotus]